jgi:hypothetical protein
MKAHTTPAYALIIAALGTFSFACASSPTEEKRSTTSRLDDYFDPAQDPDIADPIWSDERDFAGQDDGWSSHSDSIHDPGGLSQWDNRLDPDSTDAYGRDGSGSGWDEVDEEACDGDCGGYDDD